MRSDACKRTGPVLHAAPHRTGSITHNSTPKHAALLEISHLMGRFSYASIVLLLMAANRPCMMTKPASARLQQAAVGWECAVG